MNVKISIHNRNLGKRKESLKEWKVPEVEKKNLLKFLNDLELGKINKGKKISEQRQLKYLDILKIPLEFLKKSMTSLEVKDIETFEKALSSNKILTYKKTPYQNSTKVDIRTLLRVYLKWRLGDTQKFRKMTDWFDTRQIKKTPDYLSEQEIKKLYKHCKNNAERFLIAVLFDSGTRAEEFHNIRYEDIELPSKDESFVKLTLKSEYSKTEGRTISLYWINSLESIRDYLKEREQEGIKSDEAVFKNSYDNSRQFLIRLGKKVLNKSIHYHLFRNSSATFYASKLNRQQLCYRYGWKFSSTMPDVYISRAGMENKQLDEKFESTELEDVKRKLEKNEQEYKIRNEEILTLKENFKSLVEQIRFSKGDVVTFDLDEDISPLEIKRRIRKFKG